jgi:RNA polymerase sigma factor for flagellar operon FliA
VSGPSPSTTRFHPGMTHRPVPIGVANLDATGNRQVPIPQTGPNRPASRSLTPAERNKLALEHRKLVFSIARRIHARLPRHIDLDDLVHEGTIGLIEAIDRYDEHRSVPLNLFARQRITGSILDMLRNLDWVPRTVRRRADLLDEAREDLRRNLGRAPTPDEVAAALGMNQEQFDPLVRHAEIRKVASLDAPAGPESTTPLIDTLAGADDAADDGVEQDQLRAAVQEAVDRLPEKERLAVQGYYLDQRPLSDIGRELGVSESRVSQLHRMGISRLRLKVRDHIDV